MPQLGRPGVWPHGADDRARAAGRDAEPGDRCAPARDATGYLKWPGRASDGQRTPLTSAACPTDVEGHCAPRASPRWRGKAVPVVRASSHAVKSCCAS
eukprot:scaffold1629_cov369-Prasinococcus_capsulatus_cf.AAC.5